MNEETKKLVINFCVVFVAAFLAVLLAHNVAERPRMPRHLPPPPPRMEQPRVPQPPMMDERSFGEKSAERPDMQRRQNIQQKGREHNFNPEFDRK